MASDKNPYSAPTAPVDNGAIKTNALRDTAGTYLAAPRGIGGWLILPLLALIFTTLRVGLEFVREIVPVLGPETWGPLTTPGTAAYHPLWGPLIVFEVFANSVLFIFTLVLLWLFLKRSWRVPMLMIVWLLTVLAIQIVDVVLAQQIPAVASESGPQTYRQLVRAVVAVLIWIPYFLRSRRVKNTFTRGDV